MGEAPRHPVQEAETDLVHQDRAKQAQGIPCESAGGHRYEDDKGVLGSSEVFTPGQDPVWEDIDEIQVINEYTTIPALVPDDRVVGADAMQEDKRFHNHKKQQHEAEHTANIGLHGDGQGPLLMLVAITTTTHQRL